MADTYFVSGKKRSAVQGSMSSQRISLSRTRPTATRAPTYYTVSRNMVLGRTHQEEQGGEESCEEGGRSWRSHRENGVDDPGNRKGLRA